LRSEYVSLCPNCGGAVSDAELVQWGVCSRCLVRGPDGSYAVKPGKYSVFLELKRIYGEFEDFFWRAVGSPPWSLQRTWAKRILLKRSFPMASPTGTGKTTLCLVMALYQASKGRRSYIIVPTSLLVQHLLDRSGQLAARLGTDPPRVLGYYAGMRGRESAETLRRIRDGCFDILVTTDRFLYRHFDLIKDTSFHFIFVDDVDSFLKSPRNIDKVLLLMGFTQDEIEAFLRAAERGGVGGVELLDTPAPRPIDSVLVVAGATLKGRRSRRMRLFRLALNFEPGFSIDLVRNISNLYIRPGPGKDVQSVTADLLGRHGGGCLVFVPQTGGVEAAKRLAGHLNGLGYRAYAYERMNPRMLERFQAGEYDCLVGVASTRSPLARGIDLPERIRYVVFAGVPRREIRVSWEEHRPSMLLSVLRNLAPVIKERREAELTRVMGMLNRCIPTGRDVLELVGRALREGWKPGGFAGFVYTAVTMAHQLLRSAIGEEELRRIAEAMDLKIKADGQGFSILIPDVDGYIQASGRCSRMYAGGITRGVSIVVVDDEKAFRGVARALESLLEESFQEYRLDLAVEEFKICDRDRGLLRDLREGKVKPETVDILKSSLIIVESPTKARTLAYFFGRPSRRDVDGLTVYESVGEGYVACLAASQGHIVDLTTSAGYHGVIEIGGELVPVYVDIRRCLRCGEQFTDSDTCPNCGSDEIYSKRSVIEALRKLSSEFDVVFIATDPDAEGEKIGYDIYVNIAPFNNSVRRLEFHEITRKALRESLKSPRGISLNLVQAQTVRRVEDRWVGFELSRKLWERFGRRTLSAGRVQTPVLGWVIRRMEEAKRRSTLVSLTLDDGSEVELSDPVGIEEARRLFEEGRLEVEVYEEEVREETLYPPKPYTTDSLLRDASLQLRIGSSEAMAAAQRLFESGLITYHRTGSTYVSTAGIGIARSFISDAYPGLFSPRHHGEPGAHECIRPTRPLNRRQLELYMQSGMLRIPARLDGRDLALYDLIFRRFMASQMREAVLVKQFSKIVLLGVEYRSERIVGVKDPGFLKLLPIVRPVARLTPATHKVVGLRVRRVQAAQLFREGDLIAMMRERGIGRPSTYARIISVLYKRGYLFNSGGRLLATRLGRRVYDYLAENFGHLVSEELTRRLEELMEMIEVGEADYQEVLRRLREEAMLVARAPVGDAGSPPEKV